MKKYFHIIICLFAFGFQCFGQEYPCLNGVNTNYNDPSAASTALPTNPTPSGQSNFGERFVNEFNWFPISPDGLYNGYQTYGLVNLAPHNNKMLHIYNSAYSSFYYRFQNEVNYNFLPIPENGWELLAVK